MGADLHSRCLYLLEALDLGKAADVDNIIPLTGGVASDIALVQVAGRQICMKFALGKLKTAADWYAPVHRNAAEYAWLQVAAQVLPESAVQLLGRSDAAHGFAMEYVNGPDVYLWKTALLDQQPDRDEARVVGDLLGRVHAASVRGGFDTAPFHNRYDFRALRIEPYLTYTAQKNPKVAGDLARLATTLFESAQVLVHGDVSPKNILMRNGRAVILDAECATMGDAGFDPSFCLNHLVLKALHLPKTRDDLLASTTSFWAGYCAHVDWEPVADLERRVCQLLPALMLGRVDGKSPVEYLTKDESAAVRRIAIGLIGAPATTLEEVVNRLGSNMKGMGA